MRIGRLVLTHREKYIDKIREFYLDGGRTNFLVVAYNKKTVDPSKFKTADNFRLVPYCLGGEECSATGQQYRVWPEVMRKFPEIEGWVVHDYDFVCRVPDKEIFSRIKPDEYAMIGKPFPVWRPGMAEMNVDTYPFAQGHKYWCVPMKEGKFYEPTKEESPAYYTLVHNFSDFSVTAGGVKTFMAGYSDFLAATSKNFLILDDPGTKGVERGGLEEVPHSVWLKMGVKPVDLRPWYKMKVLLDVMYVPMDERYDMIHPAKVWEGEGASLQNRVLNLKRRLKNFVKWLIGYQDWKRM